MRACGCGAVCTDLIYENGYCQEPAWRRLTISGRDIMQKMSVTAEQTVEIEPEVAARVSAILSTYFEMKEQADLYTEAMKAEAAKVLAIMNEAGHEKIEVDGTPCAIVRGHSSRLDKIKFVQLGGSLQQLENATVQKPNKPYVRIGKAASDGE